MSNLKSFLITEELKTSHAERYLTYVDRYHELVFHDLKTNLLDAWRVAASAALKKYPVDAGAKQDVLLRNPKARVAIALSNTPTKLITSRSPTPLEVAPSVLIPLVYSHEECKLITKELLKAAENAFNKTVNGWGEIFNYEKKGRVTPWFKIVADHEEVRLQLAVSSGEHESYKTLYAVRMEYGKKGSKLKDFDRLYLTNLIK